ncbi:DUF3623 family protein [Actinoplanes sp. LDG1-01]|uniref:DUF3623 family protein n=2 Tax=Paractinoplanes lichenicola TaxID=2802976 RepID=A0ABS1VQP6_9ACTN|nr:DUF3623 family protein [Actinoplanes lichenicola]
MTITEWLCLPWASANTGLADVYGRNQMRHSIRAVAVVATLAASGIVFASTPASADAPVQAFACAISVTAPQKLGTSTIRVTGNRNTDCGTGNSTLNLQRQQIPGFWETVASRTLSGGGFGSLDFNCNGRGTQTYRGQQVARQVGGTTLVKNSGNVRITCSG